MQQSTVLIRFTGGLVILGGIVLAGLGFWGTHPLGRDLEGLVGAVAFGAVFAAPGVLALLALPDRPSLLLPAAVVLVPFSFVSLALVTLPLLIPAFLLFRAYLRAAPAGSGIQALATTSVVFFGLIAAFAALIVHEDPRSWTSDTAGYGTSDIVTYAESAISLGFTALAGVGGWYLAGPRAVWEQATGADR